MKLFLWLCITMYLMCGPRRLFFQWGPEMPKGWTAPYQQVPQPLLKSCVLGQCSKCFCKQGTTLTYLSFLLAQTGKFSQEWEIRALTPIFLGYMHNPSHRNHSRFPINFQSFSKPPMGIPQCFLLNIFIRLWLEPAVNTVSYSYDVKQSPQTVLTKTLGIRLFTQSKL